MLEGRLHLLFRKGSLTSRARRTFLVLVILLAALFTYQIIYSSQATWTELRKTALSQLGTHADLHDEQARIAKISILYGSPKRYYERALQSHKRHNRQHGYPMFVQRVDVLDGYWTKPAFIHYMILRELRKPESQRLQWLFWFDADTIVLNHNIPLELFLPPENDMVLEKINVVISEDWNGLNNGVFGIRVSRYAAEVFASVLAFRDFEPDTQLTFQDQSALDILLSRRKYINHVAKMPQRWFNAYASEDGNTEKAFYRPGDFLVHFAGLGDRDGPMNMWADRSEAMSPEWNQPITKTTYVQDIERFWNRTRKLHVARMMHWTKGAQHLQDTVEKAHTIVNEWRNSTINSTETFVSLAKAQETAMFFIANSTKFNGEIVIDDLRQLNKIVTDLEGAERVFSEDAAIVKAELEEKNRQKELEEEAGVLDNLMT